MAEHSQEVLDAMAALVKAGEELCSANEHLDAVMMSHDADGAVPAIRRMRKACDDALKLREELASAMGVPLG